MTHIPQEDLRFLASTLRLGFSPTVMPEQKSHLGMGIRVQKTFGIETDRSKDYLDFIAGTFRYGRKASVVDMKRDAQMAEMHKSNSTSGLLAQAHFSPALLIQDAWSNREGDKEALAIMLASTCIAHASSSERITQLSRGASKEDSFDKAIWICELRGGAYYRAFILDLRDNQPIILAFCARSPEVLDSFVKVLHLFDFSTSLQDSEQKEELEVSTAIVDSILRSAELSNIKGILEADFGIGCCVILTQIGDSNLLRLSRPVIGFACTSVVSPYTLGFERSTS